MKVVFRTDASLQIGSGHVMRCLTLADALRAQGADCHFISREHPGHLLDAIRQHGHKASRLTAHVDIANAAINNIANETPGSLHLPAHVDWLGCPWQTDAQETAVVLNELQPDWLVEDHYALDQRWEQALAPHYRKLLVIDDLADRTHQCNLLLDQNLGRQPQDYACLVPQHCLVLIGPQFALLRNEFAALRPSSLQRRQRTPGVRRLLITMGGTDQPNATGKVLQALKTCALPADCHITVVMGPTASWLQDVQELATQMPWPTEVVVNVADMAQRISDSDLSIGAAGGTSWERCCLGMPAIVVVLAKNQHPSAEALEVANAARSIGDARNIASLLPFVVGELLGSDCLQEMSVAASAITDGHGVGKVLNAMGVNSD